MEIFQYIFGLKTHAIFDVWTIEHVLTGLSVGYIVSKNNLQYFKSRLGPEIEQFTSKYFDIMGVLFLAFLWETIEHYLETGLAGAHVVFWFQGVEFWANRIIADPAALIIGYLIARKNPYLVIYARIFSLAWLLVHVFVFPHSMYLHELLKLPQ